MSYILFIQQLLKQTEFYSKMIFEYYDLSLISNQQKNALNTLNTGLVYLANASYQPSFF